MGMLMDGRAQPTGIRRNGADATLLLILNAYHETVDFLLPAVAEGSAWIGLLDSNQPQQRGSEQYPFDSRFEVAPRALLLFKLQKESD
jgi:isoamylase